MPKKQKTRKPPVISSGLAAIKKFVAQPMTRYERGMVLREFRAMARILKARG